MADPNARRDAGDVSWSKHYSDPFILDDPNCADREVFTFRVQEAVFKGHIDLESTNGCGIHNALTSLCCRREPQHQKHQ